MYTPAIDTRSPVLVVGATGTMGGLVLNELVTRHANVRVLVRTRRPADFFAPGVVQAVADLHDPDAVRAALSGVRAALYISPHEAAEEDLARNFVQAAESTGTRIVFAGVHVPARTISGRLQLAVTEWVFPTLPAQVSHRSVHRPHRNQLWRALRLRVAGARGVVVSRAAGQRSPRRSDCA